MGCLLDVYLLVSTRLLLFYPLLRIIRIVFSIDISKIFRSPLTNFLWSSLLAQEYIVIGISWRKLFNWVYQAFLHFWFKYFFATVVELSSDTVHACVLLYYHYFYGLLFANVSSHALEISLFMVLSLRWLTLVWLRKSLLHFIFIFSQLVYFLGFCNGLNYVLMLKIWRLMMSVCKFIWRLTIIKLLEDYYSSIF